MCTGRMRFSNGSNGVADSLDILDVSYTSSKWTSTNLFWLRWLLLWTSHFIWLVFGARSTESALKRETPFMKLANTLLANSIKGLYLSREICKIYLSKTQHKDVFGTTSRFTTCPFPPHISSIFWWYSKICCIVPPSFWLLKCVSSTSSVRQRKPR